MLEFKAEVHQVGFILRPYAQSMSRWLSGKGGGDLCADQTGWQLMLDAAHQKTCLICCSASEVGRVHSC